MFQLNEKVVYQGHGVAHISRIVEKQVAGQKTRFFELKFLNKDMTILVPLNNIELVGIRRLSSVEHIRATFERLSEDGPCVSPELAAFNWSRRNKRYRLDIGKGNLDELCRIYRDLNFVACTKDLSYGERLLLQQAESLLAQEISLVNNMIQEKAVEHLRSLFNPLFESYNPASRQSVARTL